MRLFGEKNVDSILARFIKAIDELDEYAIQKEADNINLLADKAEIDKKIAVNAEEVKRAEAASKNLKRLFS